MSFFVWQVSRRHRGTSGSCTYPSADAHETGDAVRERDDWRLTIHADDGAGPCVDRSRFVRLPERIPTAHAFSFPLKSGDIAFWNNYTTFHGRDGFAETDDESQKRVLLRIWMDLDNVRPFADEGRVRYGAVRHGQIGWTAEEVLAGRNNAPHRRDGEGVPVVG